MGTNVNKVTRAFSFRPLLYCTKLPGFSIVSLLSYFNMIPSYFGLVKFKCTHSYVELSTVPDVSERDQQGQRTYSVSKVQRSS